MIKRLNFGCGRDIKEGYLNIDKVKNDRVDKVVDFSKFPYPFKKNTFDEILSLGVIELIDADFVRIIKELHRISKKGAIIKIRCPAFPNMCSAQDPLTKHFITYKTFDYFCEEAKNFYYNLPKFRMIKKKYIFSINRFHWVNPIINLFPNLYSRFLFNIFPATTLYFELKVVKDQ